MELCLPLPVSALTSETGAFLSPCKHILLWRAAPTTSLTSRRYLASSIYERNNKASYLQHLPAVHLKQTSCGFDDREI